MHMVCVARAEVRDRLRTHLHHEENVKLEICVHPSAVCRNLELQFV